ncbi:MAG TPA: formate dehydrogenase subunit delta [Pseudolabrys sp.]|nr:formate dehydrogenase subunit delta [Pseudolabrys sp.]
MRSSSSRKTRRDAAEGISAHLKKLWDPRMRTAIINHRNAGGAGLDHGACGCRIAADGLTEGRLASLPRVAGSAPSGTWKALFHRMIK